MCPGVDSASKNEYQGFPLGVKAAGAWGWRPTTLVVPNVKKIRGLNLPGTPLGPCGLLWAWPKKNAITLFIANSNIQGVMLFICQKCSWVALHKVQSSLENCDQIKENTTAWISMISGWEVRRVCILYSEDLKEIWRPRGRGKGTSVLRCLTGIGKEAMD
jgi:hypothetical protein